MQMYYKIINEKTAEVQIYFGGRADFANENGFIMGEVEQCKTSGRWYIFGEMPKSEKESDVRYERDILLVDTDKYMLIDFPMSDDERNKYKEYRNYLRNYTKNLNWWKAYPQTFAEWSSK